MLRKKTYTYFLILVISLCIPNLTFAQGKGQKLEEKDKELDNSKKEQNTQQLANTFLAASGNDPQEAKNKINKIVREIDNCIALLNR